MYLIVVHYLENRSLISVNTVTALAFRDARIRLSTAPWPLHSHCHHGLNPQPPTSHGHPQLEQTQA